ncbi:hypothetical protein [Legionella jordanis]|uniref:Lipoprotein n=1 Tax=Legionella jordanis TaxID=456 RepID=A0A0W0VAT2_9GAMM|nr:hypothetical protein [Legionella jordanis]KTD16989.1 hypothetical protein Ljor_1295 [Legionella jordanis]RMX03129.1 hypothetical protein EAW55_06775 [Legionella jordanis]VEH12817.1 Uncharacterised protein [Legionella jordanis]HAT8713040.1 hypothetical protein [Legionella jordanis]
MNRLGLLILLLLLLTSCTNFGPYRLPPNRLSYNYSLQYSDAQQQLLNIVRLRYSDSPYFLTVNNIVSQYNFSNEISGEVSNNSGTFPLRTIGTAAGQASFTESPTITYTPLQGKAYVTRLLTPIDPSVIYTLLRSGWGVHHVLRMLVQRLGPVENAILASRTTSSRVPRFKEFQELLLVLRKLQYKESLLIENSTIDKQFAIQFRVQNFGGLTVKERQLLARIGITPQTPVVWLVGHPTQQKNQIYVQTRTVLGLFNYLSKSVDLPKADILGGKAPMTYMANRQIFDWRQVTAGIMRVHHAKTPPKDALVAVPYRGNWFYIADSDSESKETLNLLTVIIGIYEGNPKSNIPVFTIS